MGSSIPLTFYLDVAGVVEHFTDRHRLPLDTIERRATMKLIYSMFLLATVGLLVNTVSAPAQPLFTASEMREVNRRLNSISRP
jgi:hypothetical protein